MTSKPWQSSILSPKQVKREYYQWLCELICVNQEGQSYWILAKDLHRKEFFWTVPNDDNRCVDGKKLRELFSDEIGYLSYDLLDQPCSMLEMLVALSKRFGDSVLEKDDDEEFMPWFWEIMENCGLEKFTDEAYYDLNGKVEVDEILNNILERGYRRNGKGGLFPLKNAKKDQRKVEICYQMSAYLLENYYFRG